MSSIETITIVNDVVNSYFAPLLTASLAPPVGLPRVAKRGEEEGPYIEFGRWMRALREAKFKSQPAAVNRAKSLDFQLVTQGKLSHLERGLNGNPEPELLRQLAKLYRVEYLDVVRGWVFARYAARDLPRHTTTEESALHAGGAVDTSATRAEIGKLEDEIRVYRGVINYVRELTQQAIDAIDAESSAPPAKKRTRRKSA